MNIKRKTNRIIEGGHHDQDELVVVIEVPLDEYINIGQEDQDQKTVLAMKGDRSETKAHKKEIKEETNYEMLIGYNYSVRRTLNKISNNVKGSVPILKSLKYVKKIGFYKQLYLDHAIGCNRLDMRSLEIELTYKGQK
ncbi:10714_t:CDS:2 [Gigaspora rosea]|nr:10714_t:CDS:2 [Gigaspora rosea]